MPPIKNIIDVNTTILSPEIANQDIATRNTTQTNENIIPLDTVRSVRGDINEIRMLLKGSRESWKKLFTMAIKEKDVVSQIQLSYALFGMKWGKDEEKNFSSLSIHDLEKFPYYPREFVLFNEAYRKATGTKYDWEQKKIHGMDTFRLAADLGYLPAFLELKCTEWKWHTDSYGFAVQLRPFVGKGDSRLDFYFGNALKNGSGIGSASYYEGLYWLNQSKEMTVKYPKKDQSFESFTTYYVAHEDLSNTYYNHDGLFHIGSVILAPSEEKWNAFIQEKLTDIKLADVDSYVFEYDSEHIKSLLDQHKVSVLQTGTWITPTTTKDQSSDTDSESSCRFSIDQLHIYKNHQEIGSISVRKDTFEIYETFSDTEIQSALDFIENVMRRTGSVYSAKQWLKQMDCRYI